MPAEQVAFEQSASEQLPDDITLLFVPRFDSFVDTEGHGPDVVGDATQGTTGVAVE